VSATFLRELENAATASHVSLSGDMAQACAEHFALLLRWNETHNLTRIVDPAEAARKHYLDCLAPLLAVGVQQDLGAFIDVGSGAGFPGLLAALVWPKAAATLIEPARKRASFLVLAARAMGLTVTVAAPEATRLQMAELVLSRATFPAGKRAPLLERARQAVAVWGHSRDAATWNLELATWREWRKGTQEYMVDGLEPRHLLWAVKGAFHVKQFSKID
jgi:16S rRNA (guanine527-N7)-methyltransferase